MREKEFNTVTEQKDILENARRLLEEAAGLKKDDPVFEEEFILHEAMVGLRLAFSNNFAA